MSKITANILKNAPDEAIYFDYAATTPVDPRVIERMEPYFSNQFGNAASTHCWGQAARRGVEEAREQVGELLNSPPKCIHFTSGATEAINTVLKGFALQYLAEGCHIVTCATEHKAVIDTCTYLEEIGVEVTFLPVNYQGEIDLKELEEALREDTRLVSLMWVNNETGVTHPIQEIAKICRQKDIPLFVDATQAVGKVSVDVAKAGVDLLCCSAHKFYGPKGVGALYAREGLRFIPLLHGGGHEGGLRSGTLNTAGIVGMGAAAQLVSEQIDEENIRIARLRETLEKALGQHGIDFSIHAEQAQCVPHIASVAFPGHDARVLSERLPNLALSQGAACTSAIIEPSHVLQAMGLSEDLALSTLRFSLGRFSNQEGIDKAVQWIEEALKA